MLNRVMTISLNKLNYHPIYVSRCTSNHRSNSNPTDSKNLHEPKKKMQCSTNLRRFQSPALLSQKNIIGIIGGFSAFSTLLFLEKLVRLSSRKGEDPVPFIVCSDPDALASAKNGRTDLHRGAIIEDLKRKRVFLEEFGARCIVMPCQISQAWHEEVFKGCPVTFLSVGDSVSRELKESKLKPLEAGSNVRVGVLAADDDALIAGFYQETLQDQGFEVVLPDKPTIEHMVIPAIEALEKKDIEGARNLIRIAIQVLLVKAVNKIILASDEFQQLFPQNDPLLQKCIDPLDALARSTIKWAKSTENNNPT